MELMDTVLGDASSKHMVVKYVNIAHLRVQESAADRATLSDVVSMLGNDTAVLPCPKSPAFLNVTGTESSRSSEGSRPTFSVNYMTASVVEPT
ncbi:hypothetical protein L6164_018529 [Bauhinia variegata]|uniref:Uncharacterized protein n=1 Tax=Bauhinia variegata TaxID=167791 RepID=A0ACB9NCQ9_BAUVA|nr:hypothetical protein L6164_018529 [Bauhinia variegata]